MRVRDTCNVWVIRAGRDAICIDFGGGLVLDRLEELGIERVTDVLVTHHHRDNVQGLRRAAEAGARIWVPPVERDLFDRVDEHWARHRPESDYDVRQHRFSLLEPVEVAGVVDEYRTRAYGGVEVYTLPTPGHTIGSVSYLVELDGTRHGFTGDLLYGSGQVWSLAATQWSYGGVEGQAATILSCGTLARRAPDMLYPSHGEPLANAQEALAATGAGIRELMELRRVGQRPWNLERWLDSPWQEISPHLLRNRTSIATSYAVLSDTGAALILDWGYDLWPGTPLGLERAANRPLLESIDALRRNHGVERVEAVIATHYHDDHVAGFNLLRDVEGTEVWASANVAPILEHPNRYDLPCLWFDPIPVDRVLALGEPVAWHELELTAHPLPGHTLYAAAIELEVDGTRVLAIGDQQGGGEADDRDVLNYQYRNRFQIDDYVASAELYARLRTELLLGGHWEPRRVTEKYLAALLEDGRRLAALHRRLLPLDDVDLGAEGFAARIAPYRSRVARGETVELAVEIVNPFSRTATAEVRLVAPAAWRVEPVVQRIELGASGTGRAAFRVAVDDLQRRQVPLAADVTVDGTRFGQQAEALVTVE
jgi:glyoxylase-like metal-dependent hydrolase (beta-lactamase superfamily II)